MKEGENRNSFYTGYKTKERGVKMKVSAERFILDNLPLRRHQPCLFPEEEHLKCQVIECIKTSNFSLFFYRLLRELDPDTYQYFPDDVKEKLSRSEVGGKDDNIK